MVIGYGLLVIEGDVRDVGGEWCLARRLAQIKKLMRKPCSPKIKNNRQSRKIVSLPPFLDDDAMTNPLSTTNYPQASITYNHQ